MRIAVTGAGGRLGTSLRNELGGRPFVEALLAWDIPEHDLDDPRSAARLVDRDRPDLIVHCAAWTDVDGCARQPELAMRRNGDATGELAEACARRGAGLIVVSTNEVFDGARTDGKPYGADDVPNPINPYGASKLAGERAAARAFAGDGLPGGADGLPGGGGGKPPQLGIVRTAWLFGPGAADFPTKILAAARRAAENREPLKVVADEWGTPTYTMDLARGIAGLIESGRFSGTHHVVNGLFATRAQWAMYVIGRAGIDVEVQEVPATTWPRSSTPPRWGVLEPTPLPSGPLRPWPDAMAEYAPTLLSRRQD
jgi:dTDP-4-dehydrorhamnose reductase